jgi:hypothetical protein
VRGQIPQLFIFLAALLVIGATIFLGAKFVFNLHTIACETTDASFVQELGSVLTDNAAYGSRTKVQLSPNCDAVTICFVDSRTLSDPSAFTGNDSTITAAVRGGGQANIFLQTRDTTVPRGYDERIVLSDPYQSAASQNDLCIHSVSGRFTFTTNGYGRYVRITP